MASSYIDSNGIIIIIISIHRKTHTNFEFFRIGVILAKYIQIHPKKSITTSANSCSPRAIELEAGKVANLNTSHSRKQKHTDHLVAY